MGNRYMDEFINWFKQTGRLTASLIGLSTLLSGCMVGPDFHTSKAPSVERYDAKPLPHKTAATVAAGSAGKSQIYRYDRDIPADWWQLFHSKEIDQLVRTGMTNSPTLAAAQAALRQAQETLSEQIGNLLLPALDANLQGQRQRFAGSTFGNGVPSSLFNVFNATAKISYTLDVFGGSRRQIEALRAQVDYQQFELLATYLTLTSNIVTTAFTIASYEAQIKATEALIRAEVGQLNIITKQYQLGGVAKTNVLTQQTLVDQTRATLPQLQKSLSQAQHSLAVLIGAYPDTPMPRINLQKLHLPVEIPVSLPSKLVQQRPDIRASQALLHAASAQIGVATANLFPQFNIMGNYGWIGSVPSTLFQPLNKTWMYAGGLAQPIFHGGALFAARRAAIAAYDQAAEQYRLTVLQAFQNTADALRALDFDAKSFRDAHAAQQAAYANYRITSQQYKEGGVSYLQLLTAEQQYQQTQLTSIQAQALRYTDTASLYAALGGGWWNRQYNQCPDKVNPVNASLSCP